MVSFPSFKISDFQNEAKNKTLLVKIDDAEYLHDNKKLFTYQWFCT